MAFEVGGKFSSHVGGPHGSTQLSCGERAHLTKVEVSHPAASILFVFSEALRR